MSADLLTRLIEAGTPAALVAEVAVELGRAQAERDALEARRASDRARKDRQRHVMSRDATGQIGTERDNCDPSPETKRNPSPCTPSKEKTQPSGSDADASGAAAPLMPAYTDARHELWGEGKPILLELGVPERQCGQLIGRWLKTTGDDCAGVLDAIQRAREARPHDPIPWITRALPTKANHERNRQAQPRQHDLAAAFDRLEDHARRMEDAHPASAGWGRQ